MNSLLGLGIVVAVIWIANSKRSRRHRADNDAVIGTVSGVEHLEAVR